MRRLVVALLVLLAAAGPVAGTAAAASITVFAAADLAFAFREVLPRFEEARGVKVTLALGSTGNFAKQIERGAPADVFFAADERFIDDLVTKQHLLPATRTVYAEGFLALVTPRRRGATIGHTRELADPRVTRVAIANPRHAPYGRAAEEALRASGVWEAVRPKLVYGENVRHALQFVQTGAVDAGLVALAVAEVPEVSWVLVDPALHAPIIQAAAVVSRSAHPEHGLALIRFVRGPEGRAVMERYGFVVPPER
jgi:molybdate transport system substrate-binding protein